MLDGSETWSIALPRQLSIRNGLTGATGGRGGRHAHVLFDHLYTPTHVVSTRSHARERKHTHTHTHLQGRPLSLQQLRAHWR
jgi:hypothetical protein